MSNSIRLRRRDLIVAGGAALAAGSAWGQVGQAAPDAPRTGAASVKATRVEVPGPNGVVTAGHPLAASAGLQMLMKGGTAADAAVACMAVLNVVEPWASSAAGNGFATVFTPSNGKVRSLNFTGAAPKRLSPDQVKPEELDWGRKAATTPGAFGGWIELAKMGRLKLADLLAPAIALARDGHALDGSIATTIARASKKLALYKTTRDLFLPGGSAPAPRARFRNPDLANTFDTLVAAEAAVLKSGGSREAALNAAYAAFYTGPIGREIARFHLKSGGFLREDDLAAYKPVWTDTVTTDYRGAAVYSSPLTSRGGLEVCLQLNLIERFDMAALKPGTAPSLHLMAEAIKAAKAEIYPYAADPAFAPTPVKGLLSKDFARQRSAAIDPMRVAAFPGPSDFRPFQADAPQPPPAPKPLPDDGSRFSDTTSMTIVDRDGTVVVVTVTLGGGFGTGLVAGSTGLLLNNGMRIGSTSPYPGTANYVGGGKIPLLNNSPTIVLRGGKFELALGSPGGETIGQTEFQVLVNVLDFGMPLQEAIEAPRFSLDAAPNFYMPGAAITLQAESRFAGAAVDGLKALGHKVQTVGPYSIGSIQGARATDWGGWTAGADPRRMAAAAGW